MVVANVLAPGGVLVVLLIWLVCLCVFALV